MYVINFKVPLSKYIRVFVYFKIPKNLNNNKIKYQNNVQKNVQNIDN